MEDVGVWGDVYCLPLPVAPRSCVLPVRPLRALLYRRRRRWTRCPTSTLHLSSQIKGAVAAVAQQLPTNTSEPSSWNGGCRVANDNKWHSENDNDKWRTNIRRETMNVSAASSIFS